MSPFILYEFNYVRNFANVTMCPQYNNAMIIKEIK
jgi:hypothetical protein